MKILLVDDEQAICEFLEDFLSDYYPNASYNYAISGIEAIDFLEKNNDTNLIICDFNMPGKNGSDVYQFIVENSLKTQFVLCSTENPDDHPIFKKGSNFIYQIVKPDLCDGVDHLSELITN